MSDCPGWRLIRCPVARPSKKRMVVLPLSLRSSRRPGLRRAEVRGPKGGRSALQGVLAARDYQCAPGCTGVSTGPLRPGC